jgi:hypothetical protein
VAYWDGRDLNGRRAPSGLYYCELVVGDRREPDLIRIIVANPSKRSRFIPPIFEDSEAGPDQIPAGFAATNKCTVHSAQCSVTGTGH